MENPVWAYKSLSPTAYVITPFKAKAPFSYTYVSGSTNNSLDVNISYARAYNPITGLRIENKEQDLYDSVLQTFYSSVPYAFYGIKSASYHPTQSTYVVSITQDVFGEQIVPRTFNLSLGASTLYDDGDGELFISQSGVGYNVGRIFYDKGVAILKPTSSVSGVLSKDGIYIANGTTVNVNFSSSVTLYEHSIKIKVEPAEYNFSFYNPTVDRTVYTGSAETPIQMMISRSKDPTNNQLLAPYITAIGLYNSNNELLAIGKVSNPIQRTFDSSQTFILKFDS